MGPVAGVVLALLRRHWRSVVITGVLVGLSGGLCIAALTATRRTATALDRLVAATDFPDAFLLLPAPAPGVAEAVADDPLVSRSVESTFAVGQIGDPDADGQILLPVQAASVPLRFHRVIEGREPDPRAVDEVVLSEKMAHDFGVGVGDTIPHRALTEVEFSALLADDWDGSATGLAVDLRVVGVARTPLDAVEDDFPALVGTPAYRRALDPSAAAAQGLWLHLRSDVSETGAPNELLRHTTQGAPGTLVDFGASRRFFDDGAGVLANGLLILAAVAGLAMVALVLQGAARFGDQSSDDRRLLRDLGLSRKSDSLASAWIGLVPGLVAAGVAVVVAIVGSRWTPIGAARSVEPSPGIAIDIVPLTLGAVVVMAASVVAWARTAHRSLSPYRARVASSTSNRLSFVRSGPVLSILCSLAVPARRSDAGRRVALAGLVAGLSAGLAGIAVGGSLAELVTQPASWGQVGDDEVNLPTPVRQQTYDRLDAAPEVVAYAQVQGGPVEVDGRVVDGYWFDVRKGTLSPQVLDGRLPAGDGEVALGPELIRDLDAEIGDRTSVDGGKRTIVGTVLTPGSAEMSSFTSGALVGGDAGASAEYTSAVVEFADDVDVQRAAVELYGDLERGTATRPAVLSNLAASRPLVPWTLTVLAMTVVAAAVHYGVATRRQVRRDLAVVRALGLSASDARRALAGAIVAVLSVAATVSFPLGIVIGRAVWSLTVSSTGVEPPLALPPTTLLLPVAVIVLAAGVGLTVAHGAVRRNPAAVLSAE